MQDKDQLVLNGLIQVEIDKQVIAPIKWDRYIHHKTQEEGYLTYIPIDTLSKGRHIINVHTRNRFAGPVKSSYIYGAMFYTN